MPWSGKVHDTAQARHVLFPSAPAFALLFVWGVSNWFEKRRPLFGIYLLPLILLGLSGAQLYYFTIAFPPRLPVRTAPQAVQAPTQPLSQAFADGFELVGFDWRLIQPPAALEVVLHWHSFAYAHEDYMTELSLLDPQGNLVGQTVAHPSQGRYPTRAWDPGDTILDTLTLPLVGIPSGDYTVQLRLLGWTAPLATEKGDSLVLTQITIPGPAQSAVGFPGDGLQDLMVNLWQNGRVVNDAPTYRYRADIPITLANLAEDSGVRWHLIGPDGQARTPVTATDTLSTFIVEYDWPSGAYHLIIEQWQGDILQQQSQHDGILIVDNRDIPFDIPPIAHRLDANFDNKIRLVGYDLPTRRVDRGEGVSLLLYWQALQRMRESHVMFVRLLDQEQQVWGSYDRLPQEIYSTILWVPGEVVTDGFVLPVDPGAPDGVYQVVVGLYQEGDQQARSLPLIQEGNPTDVNSVNLGPIKIGSPQMTTVRVAIAPQVVRNDGLGVEPLITLQGYDLDVGNEQLRLTLYWRSETPTELNYTRFAHLRDEAGQTVAQSDGPPGGNVYLTSLWDPMEIIIDDIVIERPKRVAQGTYTLLVGLYNPATGQRLVVPASEFGDDTIVLTDIEID